MNAEMTISHSERIAAIKRHVRDHLDEPLDRDRLATLSGFSVIHFHRIFAAHTGETVASYVRRLRMERAAHHLRVADLSVIEVALECGYESHSAFSKAFKQHFGVTPTQGRDLAPSAMAYAPPQMAEGRTVKPDRIRTLPDTKMLYARASEIMHGHGFQTAPRDAFDRLEGFLKAHHLIAQVRQYLCIYPDEPEIGQEVRVDAGVTFAEGVEPAATEGMAYQTLHGGRWAVFLHIGPYDTLWQTWRAAYRDWLPESGESLRDAVPFEDYVDDSRQVAPDILRTEIYIPIA